MSGTARHKDALLVKDTTEAFNDIGSSIFFEKLKDYENIVICATTAECKLPENVLGTKLFNDPSYWGDHAGKALNKGIQEIVNETVFKNVVGRMHPSSAINQHAEKLINPDIKGANYNLVQDIYNSVQTVPIPQPSPKLKTAVNNYITALETNLKKKGITLQPKTGKYSNSKI